MVVMVRRSIAVAAGGFGPLLFVVVLEVDVFNWDGVEVFWHPQFEGD